MSQFSSQLRVLMEKRGLSQNALHKKTGIGQGTLSRYLSDTSPPRSAMIQKISAVFPLRADRAALFTAHAQDILPAGLRDKLTSSPKGTHQKQQRAANPRERMPANLRRAYDALGAAAIEHARVADLVIKLSAVLRRK